MAYPDKGVMGLARHNPSGQARLGLSATAGSAVLYSAIVLFGVGSASPSAPDVGGPDRRASVVLIPERTDIVTGSVLRLPQASPEPGRKRSRVRAHRPGSAVGSATPTPASPSAVESPPPPGRPRVTESASPSVSSSSPAAVTVPLPVVTVPLPVVPVPDAIVVPVPTVPALPVSLPELPKSPLDLPG